MSGFQLEEVVHKLLRSLRAERGWSEEELQILRELHQELTEILTQTESVKGVPEDTVFSQLQKIIYELEATHPELAASLENVTRTLSNMGI